MEIKLKKKSWNDINLKEYKKIVEINNRELDSDLEKDIAVLSVLCGVDEEELYNANINTLKRLLNEISWIYKPYEFKQNFQMKKLKIDDKEYIVEPDLNKFTVAQYLDFTNFWDKRNELMGNLLAVFIIPKGCKYNEGYDVIELADKLEEVFTLDQWNSVCFFFMKNWMISTKASLIFSAWELKKMIKKTKNPTKKQELIQTREQILNQIRLME